jgi:hypothetical protein
VIDAAEEQHTYTASCSAVRPPKRPTTHASAAVHLSKPPLPLQAAALLLTTLLARMLLKVSASRSRMLGRRLGCVSQISRTKNTTSSALDTCRAQQPQEAAMALVNRQT